MKKSLKKLKLNKNAVSSLAVKAVGGKADKTGGPLTCTDPTLLTWCYFCPLQMPD